MNTKHSGFSLLEALVAMLVVAVGMLGVASLQLFSMKSSHSSFQRSMAVIQASDLVERLWADACTLPAGDDAIIASWQNTHQNGPLANWTGAVVTDTSSDNLYTFEITIGWDDGRMESSESFEYVASVPKLSNCP